MARPKGLDDAMMMASRCDYMLYSLHKQRITNNDTRGSPMELGSASKGSNKGGKQKHVNAIPQTKGGSSNANVECWYCHKKGHYERDCYKKKNDL